MRTALFIAAFAASIACAHAKSTFNSSADLSAAPPLGRVFVLSRMKNTGFNEKVYEGFEKGLRDGFGYCGVRSATMHVNEMDLDPEKHIADAIAKFGPDAVLVVRQAGGNIVVGTYGTNSDLIIDMQFLVEKASKPFWHAKSEVTMLTRNMYADDAATGAKFASDTVERLRVDGLLHDCKPPPAQTKTSEN
jgi:hypothetical protein